MKVPSVVGDNVDEEMLIPTVVAYPNAPDSQQEPLIAWAAKEKYGDPNWDCYECFKGAFPNGIVAPANRPFRQGISEDPKRLYATFLKGLLPLIAKFYAQSSRGPQGTWEEANVVFIMSIPADDKPDQRKKVGEALIEAAIAAGFASDDGRHQVAPTTPTEGMASAIFAAQRMALVQEDEELRLLTADVGSGTSVSTNFS
jgi:hypothetical protein